MNTISKFELYQSSRRAIKEKKASKKAEILLLAKQAKREGIKKVRRIKTIGGDFDPSELMD